MPVIERRYAEALAEVCEKKQNVSQIEQNLAEFIDLFQDCEELRHVLLSLSIRNKQKKDILERVFGNELLSENKNLIFILLDKGRIAQVQGVFNEFVKISQAKNQVLNIKISSAKELAVEQIETIKDIYKKKYGKKTVSAEIEIDNSLIGGMKITIGDTVIDATLQSRLNELYKLTGAKSVS